MPSGSLPAHPDIQCKKKQNRQQQISAGLKLAVLSLRDDTVTIGVEDTKSCPHHFAPAQRFNPGIRSDSEGILLLNTEASNTAFWLMSLP